MTGDPTTRATFEEARGFDAGRDPSARLSVVANAARATERRGAGAFSSRFENALSL